MGWLNKQSPTNSATTASTTKNTQQGGSVTGGAGNTSVGPNLSDITGVGRDINVSTTDQGAVAAGLALAIHALDANATNTSQVTAAEAATAKDAIGQAVGVASSVAQGQQNTTFKYVTVIILGIAVVAGAVFIYRKR